MTTFLQKKVLIIKLDHYVVVKFIASCREGRTEGNILFNEALNTFYFTVIWHRTYDKESLR